MKKKKKLKWYFKLLLILILIILYGIIIGTKGTFLKEYNIKTSKISGDMHGIKIIHFSDIKYKSSISEKSIIGMVNKINASKPDIVIYTGDLIDKKYKLKDKDKESLIKNLNSITAELGKYYVKGDEDTDAAIQILNAAGFKSLENNYELIYKNRSNPILLIDKNNVKEYYDDTSSNKDIFKMLVLHNPDDIDKYLDYNIDVAIAGHTLNGQINIFKIKEMLIKEKYKRNYQKIKNTKLYINPGIGTGKINLRLFNHPTIYLYRITKTSN